MTNGQQQQVRYTLLILYFIRSLRISIIYFEGEEYNEDDLEEFTFHDEEEMKR